MDSPLIAITASEFSRGNETWDGTPLAYARAVAMAGGMSALLTAQSLGDPQMGPARRLLERFDGLLLSGGGDLDPWFYREQPRAELVAPDRRRDELELALARAALEMDLPVLGICRGHQVLVVAAGGSLIQDIPSERPEALIHKSAGPERASHQVAVEAGSRLAAILGTGPLAVNSSHHQCDRVTPPSLRVTARSPDGLVEAVEGRGRFVLGVQWHPEAMVAADQASPQLGVFRALLEAAG